MKQKKSNLLISSVAMVAAIITVFYLIMVMPEHLELIIVFSLIAIADTYFLTDGILKKIDDIANVSLDKQNEIAKVEKGIYSVAKREETTLNERFDSLITVIEELRNENSKLSAELIEQEKLFTKILKKKNQENTVNMVNSSDRIAKLLVQLTSNNKEISEETIELLKDISRQLDDEALPKDLSNVRVMTPRAE